MRTVLMIIYIFMSVICCGQTSQDSLLNSWDNELLPDTVRLEAVHELINKYYQRIPTDSIFYLAQLQYEFANKKGLKSYLAKAINSRGKAFGLFGDYDSAIESHQKALILCEEIDCKKGILESVTNLGNIFYEMKDYEKAIDYYQKSVLAANVLDNHKSKAAAYNGLGFIYKEQKNAKKAISYFTKGLKINESLTDLHEMAHSYCNLALVNAIDGEFDLAIEQFEQTFEIQKQMNLKRDMAESLMNIGNIYFILGDSASRSGDLKSSNNFYDVAIEYNEKALTYAKAAGAVTEIKHAVKDLLLEYDPQIQYVESDRTHDPVIGIQKRIKKIESKREELRNSALNDSLNKTNSDETEKDNSIHKNDSWNISDWIWRTIFTVSVILILYFSVYIKRIFLPKSVKQESAKTETNITFDSMMDKGLYISNSDRPQLNRKLIEAAAKSSLNDSDWKILNTLYQTPGINNKGIADKVSLSVDGVRSSLRKMYRIFNISKAQKNQRIALIVIAINLSNSQENTSKDI